MPKINPYAQRVPDVAQEAKSFTDPAQPGDVLTFTLQAGYDLGRELVMQQTAYDLNRRFVTGVKDDATGEFVTEAIEPVGGVTPTVNALAVTKYARLLVAQAPGPDAYGFKELCALSVTMPDALWSAILWSELLSVNKAAITEQLKKTLTETPDTV